MFIGFVLLLVLLVRGAFVGCVVVLCWAGFLFWLVCVFVSLFVLLVVIDDWLILDLFVCYVCFWFDVCLATSLVFVGSLVTFGGCLFC